MLFAVVALTSPALLLPVGPTAPPMALSAAPRHRVAPGWLLMQEEAAEPEAEAEAEPEAAAATTADAAEAVPDEKAQLKEQIAALEKELVDARGGLLAEQAAAKDAGEAGYLLLAANFERFRQKSRAELSSQDQVGRVKAVRGLLPFIDAFEPLQASVDEAAPEAKVHSFYSGVYKQFNTLLDSWEVEGYEAVVGEKLDFQRHVAVSRSESDEPAGTILEARTKGYTLAGAVVRSAECVASLGPDEPVKPAADTAAPEEEAAPTEATRDEEAEK